MARKANPDKRAMPDNQATRAIEAIPANQVTKGVPETRDKRAIPAIEASPVHAPTDSITTPILTAAGSDVS